MRRPKSRLVKVTAAIRRPAKNDENRGIRNSVIRNPSGNHGMSPRRMRLNQTPARRIESFWWLEIGRESCSSCGHSYVYETGFYCVGCDVGICSLCVEETITMDVFCLQCRSFEKD